MQIAVVRELSWLGTASKFYAWGTYQRLLKYSAERVQRKLRDDLETRATVSMRVDPRRPHSTAPVEVRILWDVSGNDDTAAVATAWAKLVRPNVES